MRGFERAVGLACAGLLLVANAHSVRAITGPEIFQATGVKAGLCVHLGCTDGVLTSTLQNDGRMLVHGLCLDHAAEKQAREYIMSQGLYGLVSVECATGWSRLPYTTNMVNLLVVDADVLGARQPSAAEIDRVLVPGGVAYVKKGNAWTRSTKAQNPLYDSWTHIHHGAGGNPVSGDMAFAPPTGLQWVGGYDQTEKDGLGPGASPDAINGFRVAQGRAFYQWRMPIYAGRASTADGSYLTGRDAFNGVCLWDKTTDRSFVQWKEYPFAYDTLNGRLLTVPGVGNPLVALDPATGAELLRFTQGATMAGRASTSGSPGFWALTGDNLVIEVVGPSLWVLDAKSGALIYKYTHDKNLMNPVYAADLDRIFVAGSAMLPGFNRDIASQWSEIVAFNTKDKSPVWKASIPSRLYGRLLYRDGILIAYRPGDSDVPEDRVVRVDVNTGKVLWQYNTTGDDDRNARREAFIWNGQISYFKPDEGYAGFLDPTSGKRINNWVIIGKTRGANGARCQLSAATPRFFLAAGIGYLKAENGEFLVREIARPTCAGFPTIANGMSYTAATKCGCYKQYRGIIAISSHVLPDFIDEGKRLEKAQMAALTAAAVPLATKGPVVADWAHNTRALKPEVGAVMAGDLSLTAVVNQHRIEARRGQEVAWSFVAGGRITSAPLVANDRCYFGSHDGWVYALRTSDGACVWRYMAAPADAKLVSHSQVESAWPVYGVALEGQYLYFSAGRHPELNGGIYVYKLQAADGAVTWNARVTPRRTWVPKEVTDARTRTYPTSMKYWPAAAQQGPTNACVNDIVTVADGVVSLPGFTADTKTGAMTLSGAAYSQPGFAPGSTTIRTATASLPRALPVVSTSIGAKMISVYVRSQGTHTVRITNAAGREIMSADGYDSETYIVSRRLMSRGLYVIRVDSRSEDAESAATKLIVD